ncbi:MAG TPA: GAF domain-containing protein [Candidatus Salinicoccus merdavium]|nr:GAF domain-containing protein [Candidatus Salinicoccus merdavium]
MNQSIRDTLQSLKEKYGFEIIALTDTTNSRGNFTFKWKYVFGSENQRWKRMEIRKGAGLPGLVLKTGKSLVIQDVSKIYDNEGLLRYPILYFEKVKSFVAMPIWSDDEIVVGVLVLGNRQPGQISESKYEELKTDVEETLRIEILKEMMAI